MKTLINITLVAFLSAVTAQAQIVTSNLVQELNADVLPTTNHSQLWDSSIGADATLSDNELNGGPGPGLSKVAATVNGGATSPLFATTLSTGARRIADRNGAIAAPLTGTTMSVELWISPNFLGTPAESHTIFETGGAGKGFSITLGNNGSGENNTMRFAMIDNAVGSAFVDVALPTDFSDGDHHQIVVTYDALNNMSFYYDGVLAGSNSSAGAMNWNGSSGTGFWGEGGGGSSLGAAGIALDAIGEGHGSVAVFRHYSDVLTGAEVLGNYTATVPEPATAALLAGCLALTGIMLRRRR